MTPEQQVALAQLIAAEVMRQSREMQDRIAAARRVLRKADDELVEALALLGIPTHPSPVAPLPRPNRRSD